MFLGSGSPGIAFYEKAGADLRVTLLDGKVVSLQNFFAMGPNGEYSRLLNGEAGTPEVTGLIAPEPFVPRDDTPALTTAPNLGTELSPEPESSPAPQPTPREPVASTYGGESLATPEGGAPAEATPAGDAGFFGMPADLVAFGAANLGLLWVGLSEDDEAPTPPPAPEEAPGGVIADSVPSDPASADPALLDPEVLALLSDGAAGSDMLDLSFGPTAAARDADLRSDDGAVPAAMEFDALYSADASGLAPYDELFQPIPAI